MHAWNIKGKGNQSEGFRCTVCGAEIKSNVHKEIKRNKI